MFHIHVYCTTLDLGKSQGCVEFKKIRKEVPVLECIGIQDPIQIQILCISFVLEN